MAVDKVPWPMGESDGSAPTPLVFAPKGFLVVILEDAEQAERAKEDLIRHGFAQDDLRVYTSQQILDDHASFIARQNVARRVIRAATTDPETPALYFGYARDGRAALWLREPERADANRAVGALPDCEILHVRYYGKDGGVEDIHLR